MKNLIPGNKLTPTFETERLRVVDKKGSRVTIEDETTGRTYQRNSSHLKKISLPPATAGDPDKDQEGHRVDENSSGVTDSTSFRTVSWTLYCTS